MSHASSRAVEYLLKGSFRSGTYETSCGIQGYNWSADDFVLHGARVLLKYKGHCDDQYDSLSLTMDKVHCPHCLAWLDFAFEVRDL